MKLQNNSLRFRTLSLCLLSTCLGFPLFGACGASDGNIASEASTTSVVSTTTQPNASDGPVELPEPLQTTTTEMALTAPATSADISNQRMAQIEPERFRDPGPAPAPPVELVTPPMPIDPPPSPPPTAPPTTRCSPSSSQLSQLQTDYDRANLNFNKNLALARYEGRVNDANSLVQSWQSNMQQFNSARNSLNQCLPAFWSFISFDILR